MAPINCDEYQAILRKDLVAFIERCFRHLCPGDTYKHNWHIYQVAAELVACMLGENGRLIVNR